MALKSFTHFLREHNITKRGSDYYGRSPVTGAEQKMDPLMVRFIYNLERKGRRKPHAKVWR